MKVELELELGHLLISLEVLQFVPLLCYFCESLHSIGISIIYELYEDCD